MGQATMGKTLTVMMLNNLRTPQGKKSFEVPDKVAPGLHIVAYASGKKAWVVRYRNKARKSVKITLGRYPEIDLAKARDEARKIIGAVTQGKDPAAEPKAAKVAKASPVAAKSFAEAVDAYIERYAKPNTRERSWKGVARNLAHIVRRWEGRDLASITPADIHDLLDSIVDRGSPIQANRTLAHLRKFWNWCIDRTYVETSPCAGISPPAQAKSRDRVLTDDEVKALWAIEEPYPFGPIVRLLILTGQRREEVAGLRWDELDLEAGLWVLPKERSKNNKAHEVPLSDEAVAILKGVPRIAGGFVFTTTGESPVSGWSRLKRRLPALTSPWVLHDIRRTVVSGMARLKVALPVIERVVNHTSGSFGGITGVYQHYSFSEEKRKALDLWSAHVLSLSGPSDDKMIDLAKWKARG